MMAGLRGFMCILNILVGLIPGAVGFIGDDPAANSLSEGAPPPCASPTTEWSTAFEQADASPLVKGILHQKNFYRLNLIFWIVLGCGTAHFARRGLKTT